MLGQLVPDTRKSFGIDELVLVDGLGRSARAPIHVRSSGSRRKT